MASLWFFGFVLGFLLGRLVGGSAIIVALALFVFIATADELEGSPVDFAAATGAVAAVGVALGAEARRRAHRSRHRSEDE